MTFKRRGVASLAVIATMILAGCGKKVWPPKDNPINHTEIVYNTSHEFNFNPNTYVRSTYFLGYRHWLPIAPNAAWEQHFFKFDDDSDTLTLSINDHVGLLPGDSYSYFLSQRDTVTGAVNQQWVIKTENTAPGRKHIFQFVIKLNNGSLSWDPARRVAGLYDLSQSTRDLGVTVTWDVRNPIQATDMKELPD
jgi:hypothetical protein